MTNAEIVKEIGTSMINVYVLAPDSLVLKQGGQQVELDDLATDSLYLLSAQGIDYAKQQDEEREMTQIETVLSPNAIYKDDKGGICIVAGNTVFSTINFSKEYLQSQANEANKKLAADFKMAMAEADKSAELDSFASLCKKMDIYFDMHQSYPDSLPISVYRQVSAYLTNHNINPDTIQSISKEEFGYIFADAKRVYDERINNDTKSILQTLHAEQKPIILVPYIWKNDLQLLREALRQGTPAQIQSPLNLAVTPLGSPNLMSHDVMDLSNRTIDKIQFLGGSSVMFVTNDCVFVHCGNPMVRNRLHEMQKDFLYSRGLPLPQIDGKAGVLQAMAEYRNIPQPAVLKEFIAAHGAFRHDALEAAQHIFEEYNEKNVPIFVSAHNTCFTSLDGSHNLPHLLFPGDEIKINIENGFDDIRSIGDTKHDVPAQATVLSVHSNEHGSIVITDAGVFALGGIGENIINGLRHMERESIVQSTDNQEQTNDTIDHDRS